MSVAATASNIAVAVGTLGLAAATFALVKKTASAVGATRDLAVEGIKTRLDARAPHITVLVKLPDWPWLEPSDYGAPNPIPAQQYRIPRDASRPIMIRASGSIINDGTTHARVMLYDGVELVTPLPDAGGGAHLLAPGETAPLVFQRQRPISEWIVACEKSSDAPPQSKLEFQVSVLDSFDEGISDTIIVELQAYPVEPVPGLDGSWQIKNVVAAVPPAVLPYGSVVYPRTRRYWRSIAQQQELV